MWYFISLSDPDVKYTLLIGKTYVIGRKDCDIVIQRDAAISRKHAQIQLTHPESNLSNPQRLPLVILRDTSKFGTWVGGVKMTTNEEKSLSDGDEIILGSPKSTFTLVYEPFIITTSCLDNASKKKVKSLMCVLGGHMVNEWKKECSYLVMSSISVTIKVISAMVSLKHIVLPEYLEKLVKHLQDSDEKPDPENFQPPISEKQIDPDEVSFQPDNRRRSIFQGMKFIFLNPKQFKKMSLTVELAGGLPVLMEEGSDNDDKMMVEPGSVVMQSDPNDNTQGFSQQGTEWITYVAKYLKKHKKYMIQDAELGFAVLYCSTERHCNPNIDFVASQMIHKLPSQTLSQAEVLVHDTEPGQRSPVVRGRNDPDVVNESRIAPKKNTTVAKRLESQQATTREGSNTERLHSMQHKEKVSDEETTEKTTSISKRIKQEKVTPVKPTTNNTGLRRSPRRSPSPVNSLSLTTAKQNPKKTSPSEPTTQNAKITTPAEPEQISSHSRTSKVIPLKTSPKSPAKTSTKCKSPLKHSEKQRSDHKQTKVLIVDDDIDDDDDLINQCPDIIDLDSDDENGKGSAADDIDDDDDLINQCPDIIDLDSDDENGKGSAAGWTNTGVKKPKEKTPVKDAPKVIEEKSRPRTVNRRGKREIIEDSDDEMELPRNKRLRKEIAEDSDDDDTNVKTSKNRRNARDGDDDLFSVSSSSGAKRKTKDAEVNEDTGSPNGPQGRNKHGAKLIDSVMIKTEKEDDFIMADESQARNSGGSSSVVQPGFLNAHNASEGIVVESKYIKEEDMPSKCVVTKFINLVAGKPRSSEGTEGGDEAPEGYTRWKGKLVKNFKKFRKAEHTGAGGLPRIIGGSDLEAHIGTQRKEIDDWFREAIEAESQQNEADRRAQELFDYEPKNVTAKKRGR